MNLAISNIAWAADNDLVIYERMQRHGFSGLEIAPTRVFTEMPYEKLDEAKKWSNELWNLYGFIVPSMQSIWYGRQEKLFGRFEERDTLLEYTKKGIRYAEAIGCRNLVFGCPRNRQKPENADESVALSFFKTIGDYAAEHGTVIAIEANPSIYNTNYINDTASAIELIGRVQSEGFKLNLDTGTMIENEEDVSSLLGKVKIINHIHISEPGLKIIKRRDLHSKLRDILKNEGYDGFVSIEMGKMENINDIDSILEYVRDVFG